MNHSGVLVQGDLSNLVLYFFFSGKEEGSKKDCESEPNVGHTGIKVVVGK